MRSGLLVIASALCMALLPARGQPLRQQSAGDLRYTCGGIGADERRALESLRGDARLEIVLATAKRGAYLSDVAVAIQAGGAPAVRFVASGPICLVDAPPGSYRIEARQGEVVRAQNVKIGGGRTHARIVMTFPDEPWDGILASEEEKRQAREP
jgi:hypothetical protein